jgi:hypothetical protein
VTLDSTFSIITEAPPKEYLTDFGDGDGPPKNAHLRRIDGGVIPGYNGIAILYHPDTTKKAQDCIDGTHVWIHNEKGFLTQVYLEEDRDKFKLVRGPRRPDIEAHNQLDAAERRRRRHEGGKHFPIPLDSDNEQDNVRPPSPVSTDQQPNSPTTDEEPAEDHTNIIIRHSPLISTRPFTPLIHEHTMATATATTTTTTTTKPKIVASVQKKLDTAMKQQPSNNPGGSGNPGGGNPGGGGGNLGGGGNPGAPNPPAAPPMHPPNQDACLMGSAPTEFDGDRAKADQFINELRHYFCVNATVPGLQSWIRRVAIALTFIKGPTVDKWALNQGDWVDRLDPLIEDVPDVWLHFLIEFRNQFQDTQAEERARLQIESMKMKWPDVDQYIQDFERVAQKAKYPLTAPATIRYFLKGLTKSIVNDIVKPPKVNTYTEIKQ